MRPESRTWCCLPRERAQRPQVLRRDRRSDGRRQEIRESACTDESSKRSYETYEGTRLWKGLRDVSGRRRSASRKTERKKISQRAGRRYVGVVAVDFELICEDPR